jgi:PAS domain S-box-containing protein
MPQERAPPVNVPAASAAGRAAVLLPPSLGWTLLVYAALVLASGWAYSALRIRTDREQTIHSEGDRLRAVAVALETSTLAMINDGVGSATTAAREVEAAGSLDALPAGTLLARLGKSLNAGAYVRSEFLADSARFARVGHNGAPELTSSPPGWLTALRSPAVEVWVGNPIPDPDRAGASVVPVARHLQLARNPDLWAGALLDFKAFEGLRTQLGGPGGVIGLLTSDGTLLAAAEDPTNRRLTIGRNYSSSPLYRQVPASLGSGVVQGPAPAFGTDMVFAFGRVGAYPLTVVTGRPLESVLAPWRERTLAILVVAAASSALVVVMTVLLSHSLHALRRRELHYRTLFNNAGFSVFLLEGNHFIACNETAVRMFGLPSQQAVVGLTPWILSPEEQPPGEASSLALGERIAHALRRGNITFEWMHKRLDTGATFPTEVDLSSLHMGRTTLTLAVVHDLTEQKRAEQERRESEAQREAVLADLRQLAGELTRIQDEERRRIGRELHDATGQTLSALELDLARLEECAGALAPEQRARLADAVRLAQQCATEIRTASYLLHPPLLDELGLVSALRWLADGLRERGGIEVRLALPESMDRLAPEEELTLFRVAQEALTNAQRHARSPWVALRLTVRPESVSLEVEDAGRGIAGRESARTAGGEPVLGVGLAGMRERIRQVGGTFAVESTTGGTRVFASVPRQPQSAAARSA